MRLFGPVQAVLSSVFVFASIAGLCTFAYTLTQQGKIQQGMDSTITQVNTAVGQTTSLVQHTAAILSPLDTTTGALAAIEKREQGVVSHLDGMNQSLSNLALTESQTINRLKALNQVAQHASNQVQTITTSNGDIFSLSHLTTHQAQSEAAQLNSMNTTTKSATAHLQNINHRLDALKLVP